MHGRGISVELDDGTEWLIFDSYEDAEKACVEDVEEQLREDPSMFSQEWLQNHLSVTDTDRRIMADEEADNRLEDFEGTDEEKEAEREKVYDEWYEGLKNPVSFLVDEQGIYSREDLLKQNFISIDYDEASKDAVDTDGVAHFFASYDGEEKVLKDGKYAYRTN